LTGCANYFAQANITGKHTDNMGASGYPDESLVLLGIELPAGIYLKKLRMQWSLKKAEHQLFYSNIDLW
jgi:hypothetical protein